MEGQSPEQSKPGISNTTPDSPGTANEVVQTPEALGSIAIRKIKENLRLYLGLALALAPPGTRQAVNLLGGGRAKEKAAAGLVKGAVTAAAQGTVS